MPVLVVHRPNDLAFFVVVRDGLRVGRGDDNDLTLPDSSVSRQHACFLARDAQYAVRDLSSKHGTYVNDVRVETALLRPGDRVRLGRVSVVYAEEAPHLLEVLHQQLTTVEDITRPLAAEEGSRLRLLHEISRALGSAAATDAGPAPGIATLGSTLDCLLETFGAWRAVVRIEDGEPEGPRFVERRREGVAPGADTGAPARPVAGPEIAEALIVPGEAVLLGLGRPDDGTSAARSGRQQQQPSLGMAAPLEVAPAGPTGRRRLGWIYAERPPEAPSFSQVDLSFLTVVAHLVAAWLWSSARHRSAARAVEALRGGDAAARPPLLGGSAPMAKLQAEIRRLAAVDRAHVLIRGETGTGKELVARALHQQSPRADQPFVTVNCAALPETLVESELFGHERGSFTGAQRALRGKFQLAHGGTLLLDEIGDLSAIAQAKILRAVEYGEIQPIGSERTLQVDVRVLAATHKDLAAEVLRGGFRQDLFFRLAVADLEVPPLRQRGGDLRVLAESFLADAARRLRKALRGFSSAALAVLAAHDWPGNVRELQHEIERAAIHAGGDLVGPEDLTLAGRHHRSSGSGSGSDAEAAAPAPTLAERFARLESQERELVEDALTLAAGNLSEAARSLGITRIMVKRRAARFGLPC